MKIVKRLTAVLLCMALFCQCTSRSYVSRFSPTQAQENESLTDASVEKQTFPDPLTYFSDWKIDTSYLNKSQGERQIIVELPDGVSCDSESIGDVIQGYVHLVGECGLKYVGKESEDPSVLYFFEGSSETNTVDPYAFYDTKMAAVVMWHTAANIIIIDYSSKLTLNTDIEKAKSIFTFESESDSHQTATDSKADDSDVKQETKLEEKPEEKPKAEKVLVSEGISSDVEIPSGALMHDFAYYAKSELKFAEKSYSDVTMMGFEGSGNTYEVVKAYVEMLCSEYDFKIVGKPCYSDFGKDKFFDFVLDYNGPYELRGNKTEGAFCGDKGDIAIYGTIGSSKTKGGIWYNSKLVEFDGGQRYGKASESLSLVGKSVTAGLYKMPDGSYETTDGVFNVKPGEAIIMSDGKKKRFNAKYVLDLDDNEQQFIIDNGGGIQQLKFYFPISASLETGDVFTEPYFIVESNYAQRLDYQKQSSIPNQSWKTMFCMLHDNGYVIPIREMNGEMKRLNVRVVYWEQNVAAVVHACAQFDCAPYEMEVLMAVPLGKSSTVANKPNDEFTILAGQSIKITAPKEFDTQYDTWSWEFIEGSSLAELSGTVAQTCTLSAHTKTGDVRIKVTYEYGKKEPDVLTGDPRTVGRSKTLEYVIHIVK